MVRLSPGSPSQWKATLSPLAGQHVAVEAVVADVELAADEPLRVRQLPLADGVPLLGPVEQVGGLARPEALVVARRLVVQRGVGDQRVALELLRRRERALLVEQRVDGVVFGVAVAGHGAYPRRRRLARRREVTSGRPVAGGSDLDPRADFEHSLVGQVEEPTGAVGAAVQPARTDARTQGACPAPCRRPPTRGR